ncbi:uncharacterized protein LY89DRAFT_785768 [Mollisia scopiformis]|uniref:Nephrocystin 3-like N-terminal domain-containing protein n=1 Tax=Mollisia scopiformis TaxID=149040 RepID=A0A194WWT7_MOLSC|nr:uncharacterized protein LY89DRAFT_785768 [Mollisia scopiformis]KUJ12400.1 hypothetical protein LY89DRAFT_785768 [Mollisia scopiformis]
MAEAIALGASIIAIVQIADRVFGLCKFYVETVHDCPADIRAILIETSMMKAVLENVGFLVSCNNKQSTMLDNLSGTGGPIQGCQDAITKLEELFPSMYAQAPGKGKRRRQKVKASLAYLMWPMKAEKAKKLVEDLGRLKMTISLALTAESTHDIKHIKNQTTNIQAILSDSQRHQIYQWLQSTDPTSLHYRACKQYEVGTGNWMLRSAEWKNWLEGKTRCVWISGIPAAGKTVLASHLIENITERCGTFTSKKCASIYYYCYFGHNQEEARPFLRWTISQLCRQAKPVPTCLTKLYDQGREPSLVDLLRVLEGVLEAFDSVYLVIDAIDESMPRDDLLAVLRDLTTDSRFRKIQLLATSRQYIDIEQVMETISAPVSMTNPLLDADIKLYVQARLDANSRFRHWPRSLLDDVLEVVSTKAKGMFRRAVCQIHVLERLRPENNIVKKALGNLPKTLDETYERIIFLSVPDEHRMVVLYTLKWIYYHQEVRNESISLPILLQAVERSLCYLSQAGHDYFLDETLLRELCGCLIIVEPAERIFREDYEDINNKHFTINSVSFAHYTIWEFLNSSRIVESSAAFFALREYETKMQLTGTVLHGVLNADATDLWKSPHDHTDREDFDVFIAGDEHLDTYCIAMSVLCLWTLGDDLAKQDHLVSLSFDLLDESKTYVSSFKRVARIWLYPFLNNGAVIIDHFGTSKWRIIPKPKEAAILTNLLLVDQSCQLARRLIEQFSMPEILQAELSIDEIIVSTSNDESDQRIYMFQGSIFELFAQLENAHTPQFRWLIDVGVRFLDPWPVLYSLICVHSYCWAPRCDNDCPLSQIIKLTLNVNSSKHAYTTSGADPNGLATNGGSKWEEGTVLAQYNDIGGLSPLELSSHEDWSEIRELLLRYGAVANVEGDNNLDNTDSEDV